MARFALPFFSTKYKTDVTIHCLLKALSAGVVSDDQLQLQAEEEDALIQAQHAAGWQSPEIERIFKFDTFFSLCMIDYRFLCPIFRC